MARVLHLWKSGADAEFVADTISTQVDAGDSVTLAVLDGEPPAVPPGVHVRRLDADLTYRELVELIFDAEQVVPW